MLYKIVIFSFLFFHYLPAKTQIDSVLFSAIENCDMHEVQQRLSSVIDINAIDHNGANALMWAVYHCNLPMTKYLVQHGAKVADSAAIYYKKGYYGSLQSIASCKGKLEILKYLGDSMDLSLDELEYNPHSRKKEGWTPLSCAAFYGHLEMVKYLLHKGVQIDTTDSYGTSNALIKAADKGHWPIFNLLIKASAKTKYQAVHFTAKADKLLEQSAKTGNKNYEIARSELLIELARVYFGQESTVYIDWMVKLARVYNKKGEYDKALPLFLHAMAIYTNTKKEEYIDNAYCLLSIGDFFNDLGQFNRVATFYKKALSIYRRIFGEKNGNYLVYLTEVAGIYNKTGEYEKAFPLLQTGIDIYKNSKKEADPGYADCLLAMANLYYDFGQYEKAILLGEQALSIRKKLLGEESNGYAISLNNLGIALMKTGEYDKALSLFLQAIEIYKKVSDEEKTAPVLSNMAVLYLHLKKYEKALPLSLQALAIRKKSLGEKHPGYASGLSNLAVVYFLMNEPDKAIPLFQEALFIRKNTLGEEHPDYAANLNDLGLSYINLQDFTNAYPFLLQSSAIKLKHLLRTYSTLSENEKLIFLNTNALSFNCLPSVLTIHGIRQSAFVKNVYRIELALKGMVLQDQQRVFSAIHKRGDSTAVNLYEKWRTYKTFLGRQLLLPLKNRVVYLDSLTELTNQTEQKLSRYSSQFNNQLYNQSLTPNDIIHNLTKGQAAIEFIRFKFFNKKWTDSVMYAAMILLPGDTVARFVPLFEEKQLLCLLKPADNSATAYESIKKLYASSGKAGGLNDSLYDLIWKPLEKYLTGIYTVSYAPAGLLHRISFQALRSDPTHFLIDKYQLNQMLSTRSVALPVLITKKPSSVSIWGDIKYTIDNSIASHGSKMGKGEIPKDTAASSFNFYNWDTRGSRGREWIPLPGTKMEMNSLKKIFSLAGIPISSKAETVASEEAFKALDGNSPQVLHLATHGFFLPVPETKPTENESLARNNPFTVQQNPLFRSGLVLAGGNNAWKGEAAIPGKEDGILTAYEIAQMDLSNTDLVVLSACGTALGDLQGNEGAIGLQRAFKLAGVKQMIISLWPVPDVETAALMTLFYKYWLSGKTTREALKKAQLKMKEKYPSPYYWAAFVVEE